MNANASPSGFPIASETGYSAGYGFAIPINLARTVMQQLVASGRVQRAVIGVMIQEARPEDAQADVRELREGQLVHGNRTTLLERRAFRLRRRDDDQHPITMPDFGRG